jgi:hypothetical protein
MEVLYPRCCGLDVHKDSVVARIRCVSQPTIEGQSDPEKLADLAKGTARKKRAELIEALHGCIRPHHRGLLKVHLNLVVTLEQAIADIDATVGKALESIHKSAQILSTIPGISDVTAHVIVAEIGVDMTRFATDAHLRSWAGFCPRSDESAGKRRSTRVRKGAPWLKTTLVSAAWAAVRVKESYLQAQFHRLRARPERKKPSSPSLLPCPPPPITCSRMASNTKISAPTTSLAATARRSSCAWVRRINDLGCQVQLVPQAA